MTPVRHLLACTLALGAALVVVPAPPAGAAGTCRGESPTLVGTPGETRPLTGTEGRDVVVTNGALVVDTLGGDDLVCVTGRTFSDGGFRTVRLTTGAGDDVVDGTGATGWSAEAVLGEGSDEFHGGPHGDRVTAGTLSADFRETVDTAPDTVRTGSGEDSVSSGSGTAVNPDTVDLGAGNDSVAWRGGGGAGTGTVAAGDGRDTLTTVLGGGTARLDNAEGRGYLDGASTVSWSGLDSFFVFRSVGTTGGLEFRGGPAAEEVTLEGMRGAAAPGVLSVDLGAGDDAFRTDAPGAPGSGYAGGPGRDSVVIGSADATLELDLRRGRLAVDGRPSAAGGFETAHLLARRVTLRGTDGPDVLLTTGCRQTIAGRSGRDLLRSSYDGFFETFVFDCTPRARFSGGAGRDRLRGSLGPDRLIGGAGRDVAEGRGGRDVCRVERSTKCERR